MAGQALAAEAVLVTVQISQALAAGKLDETAAQLQKMEAFAAFEAAYKVAFKEAYIASVIADLWLQEISLIRHRRAVALLLLVP